MRRKNNLQILTASVRQRSFGLFWGFFVPMSAARLPVQKLRFRDCSLIFTMHLLFKIIKYLEINFSPFGGEFVLMFTSSDSIRHH